MGISPRSCLLYQDKISEKHVPVTFEAVVITVNKIWPANYLQAQGKQSQLKIIIKHFGTTYEQLQKISKK